MGLRNAFDYVATEGTLRKLMDQMRWSRDAQDRIRVIIDNQPSTTVWMNNSGTSIVNASGQPGLFQPSSWNVMDAREEFRDISLQSFQITRNRWTIT